MRTAPRIEHGGVEPKRPKKELDHIRIKKAENGGHVIEHHFTSYEHQPESHAFGKDQREEALAHISKHMGVSMGEPEEDETEEESTAGE